MKIEYESGSHKMCSMVSCMPTLVEVVLGSIEFAPKETLQPSIRDCPHLLPSNGTSALAKRCGW